QVMPQLLEAFVFNIVVVILAWKNLGLYSYSWAIILGSIAGLGGYYLVSPWQPSWNFSKARLWKLVSFGLQFQGKNYLAVVKDQLLTLFLTRTVGFSGIGYWGFAQRWAYSPFRFIVDSVTKVSFPTYARLQHDSALLKASLEKSLFIVSLTLFPMLVSVAFLGRWFVELIPRLNQYQPALLSLYLLCFQAGISALSNILVNVLDANGRVKTTLGLMTMWIVLTWVLTVSLVGKIGFNGIALAQLLVALTIFITIYFVNKIVRFSFVRPIIKPLSAVILMIALGSIFPGILGVVSAIIMYCLVVGLIARKELMANAKLLITTYR
ncbi:oligosaccharide flippase family protein, partial [Candidatus Gottesmanbacteria bacterium]|nr:oligosaccharide flippase family protein [Candidatus Gottesmanbacteria bacterium]